MIKIISKRLLFFSIVFLVSCSYLPDNQRRDSPHVDITQRTADARHPSQRPELSHQRTEQRSLSHQERFSGVLDAHNRIRSKYHLPPLRWSEKLAKYSQEWANRLGKGNHCQMYHRQGDVSFGENLYRSSAIIWTDGVREINPVTIKDVVKAWTDEERWYNYRNNRCQPGQQCGHFTQIVWKNTQEVGCAMTVCKDKSQTWVCSYNPPGNYIGLRPY